MAKFYPVCVSPPKTGRVGARSQNAIDLTPSATDHLPRKTISVKEGREEDILGKQPGKGKDDWLRLSLKCATWVSKFLGQTEEFSEKSVSLPLP